MRNSQFGFWFGWGRCGRWWGRGVGSCVGADVRSSVLSIILWTISSHVALGSTSEATSLRSILGSFFFCEFLEGNSVSGVYIHWDHSIILGVG